MVHFKFKLHLFFDREDLSEVQAEHELQLRITLSDHVFVLRDLCVHLRVPELLAEEHVFEHLK